MFSVFQKILIFFGILFCLFINSSKVWSNSNVGLVEIKLLDNLDDKRGFCIDIKGHKFKAKIKRGIQVHTCYSYQGKISVDQGLDAKKLKQRQLFFPNFGVCLQTTSYKNPISLNLIKCRKFQEFIFNEDNTIRLKSNKTLCLTVSKENSRKGGGGSPLHLMRNVSMQKCNEKLSYYQSWGVRYFSNGEVFKVKLFNFN